MPLMLDKICTVFDAWKIKLFAIQSPHVAAYGRAQHIMEPCAVGYDHEWPRATASLLIMKNDACTRLRAVAGKDI